MNLTNYIIFTCELSWRASKAASCAGIGPVSLSPPALLWPFLLLVLAVVGGRRVAGPPPAQLLPTHQETWQSLWRSNNQSYSTWKHCKCTAQPGCIQRKQQDSIFMPSFFNYNPGKTRTTTLKKSLFSWGRCCPECFWYSTAGQKVLLIRPLIKHTFYGGLLHIVHP